MMNAPAGRRIDRDQGHAVRMFMAAEIAKTK
jgi:hypothetical protein